MDTNKDSKAEQIFKTVVRSISGIAIFSIFCLIIVQVFFRYILRSSMGGAEELPTYIMAVACWLSVPVAAMEDNHISIDLLPNMFHGRARVLWTMWAELVEVVTMTVFTVLAAQYTQHMFVQGNVTGGLGIPLWIFYVVIIIGAGLCAFFGLLNFLKNLRRVIKWQDQ